MTMLSTIYEKHQLSRHDSFSVVRIPCR